MGQLCLEALTKKDSKWSVPLHFATSRAAVDRLVQLTLDSLRNH